MLTGKQKRFLRALATAHDPIVQVGKAGITDNVLCSLGQALDAREIVKVKVLKNCLEDVKAVAEELALKSDSDLVQVIGRNIVLFKAKEDSKIELPK